MKKMLILALIGLFYIGISAMVPPQKVVVDTDVGYSLAIDQNVTFMNTIPVTQTESILLDRGVSVPYRGLMNESISINFKSHNFQVCRIDNYRQHCQESISTNSNYPAKGVNLFACDLGNRKS